MRIHRLGVLLFAAAIAAVSSLPAPAQAADPIVTLLSASSGKCLQPANGSTFAGERIVQQSCNGSLAQKWTVKSLSGSNKHLVNRASNLCLNAHGRASFVTPIDQWPCSTISNETWSFGAKNDMLVSGVSGTFSHCLAAFAPQNGLPVELRTCNRLATTQLWFVTGLLTG